LAQADVYSYFLRDFSVASIELLFGPILIVYGLIIGIHGWMAAAMAGVTLPAEPLCSQRSRSSWVLQMFLSFLNHDIARSTPTYAQPF